MLLWVTTENPYRKFYESLVGRLAREKTMKISGKMIAELQGQKLVINEITGFIDLIRWRNLPESDPCL
jgi:hypothetical protein